MKKLKPILQNAKIGAQSSFISRKIIPQVGFTLIVLTFFDHWKEIKTNEKFHQYMS